MVKTLPFCCASTATILSDAVHFLAVLQRHRIIEPLPILSTAARAWSRLRIVCSEEARNSFFRASDSLHNSVHGLASVGRSWRAETTPTQKRIEKRAATQRNAANRGIQHRHRNRGETPSAPFQLQRLNR